jgi:alanine racemase
MELRAAGIAAPVLILGCGLPEQAAQVVEHGLAQTLATEEMARALSQAAVAGRRGKACVAPAVGVHIKVDTGMGRLGVRPHEALAFARLVSSLPGLRIDGIYSHLATADHDDATYALAQARQFREVLAELARNGISPPLRHLANSAAAVRFPQMRLDLMRTGLLIYGLNPLPRELSEIGLSPALSLKTRICCIKHMPAGQRLSYGGLYITQHPTRIAYVPVGYADGYPRALSNIGWVLVGGRRCPVVGAVCMDQMLVDLGEIEAKAGDEVVLIGEQMGERITANELAAAQGTVVHEIIARLGKRLPRVYLGEGVSAEGSDGGS